MEGQYGHENYLRLMSLDFGGNTNNVSHSYQDNPNQQHIMPAGRNQMLPVDLPLPHWIHCQQTSHSYVKYLAESGASEIQREMPYNKLGVASNFTPADSSIGMDVWKGVKYMRPHNEGGLMNNFTSAEYQIHVQKQESNEPHPGVAVEAQGFSSKLRNRISRQRATATDRTRRMRIAERLDALKELLPQPKEGSKASLLDDIIDHIKYLQLQIKDLSRSRLGGESTSDSFIFLEGYGHYLLQELMLNEPLEEMIGKLLEVNPLAASELLESRGLVIMPTAFAEGLHQSL
ncbi:Transcription factor bHLH66 [Camellia lanceoleosa]|uniref:Transcription factor bHLH66 n=1 Tax=Camellia lanceoleosa TaxID=1840588 RepID=A0ACC0F5S3_9ERIC|nr:Transcription factor bHLH66 [Camellia lanceoleosa]